MPILLPRWPEGTAAVLATAGGAPHAIPVSTLLRAGDDALLLALSHRRESLRRLRESPRVAVCVMAAGGVAFTADGSAAIVDEPLGELERMVGVRVTVDALHDHMNPDFAIDDGVQWRWTDPDADARDRRTREVLKALASAP